MSAIVIGMEAAGRTRQGIAPAQPCATRDSAQIKPTCVTGSLLFKTHCKPGAREVVTVRIRVGSGRAHRCIHRVPQAHELARIQFQSVHASRAVTAGVLSVISAPLRLFILRAVKVARHLFSFLHSALRVLQDFACNGAKSFHVFLSLLPTAPKNGRRMRQGVVRA